jgi:hypothetical protein
MTAPDYFNEFPAAIEVCDLDGILLYVNERAASTVVDRDQLGKDIFECHPEAARAKLEAMLASGQPNIYTIEKAGQRKLIYQAPWYVDGVYAGFIELALPIPNEMPHFVRG